KRGENIAPFAINRCHWNNHKVT
ncbi:hypothetical protein VCHENC02_5210B, partial [Vibrio harveyi]